MDDGSSAETMSEAVRTLRERARALAVRLEPAQTAAMLDVLEFRLGQERYALETAHVREVCTFKHLTPLPSLPPFVRGIVNVRGLILPVLDLKSLLDLPEQGVTDLHRVIVVEGNDLEFGLLADAAVGVRAIPADSLHAAPATLTGLRADYLKGVTAERLVVLDVTRILADSRLIVHQDVEN